MSMKHTVTRIAAAGLLTAAGALAIGADQLSALAGSLEGTVEDEVRDETIIRTPTRPTPQHVPRVRATRLGVRVGRTAHRAAERGLSAKAFRPRSVPVGDSRDDGAWAGHSPAALACPATADRRAASSAPCRARRQRGSGSHAGA
jgi:hypothetical protein